MAKSSTPCTNRRIHSPAPMQPVRDTAMIIQSMGVRLMCMPGDWCYWGVGIATVDLSRDALLIPLAPIGGEEVAGLSLPCGFSARFIYRAPFMFRSME